MVFVLLDGVIVEATAEVGDYDEFDTRAFDRALGPIPKREFVEQAGERGCFEFRSVTVSDGKVVNQLPSCR